MKPQVKKLLKSLENPSLPPRILRREFAGLKLNSFEKNDWKVLFSKNNNLVENNVAILLEIHPSLVNEALQAVAKHDAPLQPGVALNPTQDEMTENMNHLTRCIYLMSHSPIQENPTTQIFLKTLETIFETRAWKQFVAPHAPDEGLSPNSEAKRQLLIRFVKFFYANLERFKSKEIGSTIDSQFMVKTEIAWLTQYNKLSAELQEQLTKSVTPTDRNKPSMSDPIVTDRENKYTDAVIGEERGFLSMPFLK